MTYVYDAENRLIEVGPTVAKHGDRRIKMTYDYMGRRVRTLTHEWCDINFEPDPECGLQASDWLEEEPVEDLRFIYDCWNVVMERDASGSPLGTTESVRRKYAWGCDLSGLNGAAASGDAHSAVHGAGGIGGLLAMEATSLPDFEEAPKLLYFYDGNGNVGQLVTFDSGTPVEEPENPVLYLPAGESASRYEYDPFGGTLVASDDAGLNNPFRYSTKYYGDQLAKSAAGERGLYYYGYRYYSPRLGRWVNRDPIEEHGGLHLYGFTENNPLSFWDSHGLSTDWDREWRVQRDKEHIKTIRQTSESSPPGDGFKLSLLQWVQSNAPSTQGCWTRSFDLGRVLTAGLGEPRGAQWYVTESIKRTVSFVNRFNMKAKFQICRKDCCITARAAVEAEVKAVEVGLASISGTAEGGGTVKMCSYMPEPLIDFYACVGLKADVKLDAWIVGVKGSFAVKGCWSATQGLYSTAQWYGKYTQRGFFYDDEFAFGGTGCLAGDCGSTGGPVFGD